MRSYRVYVEAADNPFNPDPQPFHMRYWAVDRHQGVMYGPFPAPEAAAGWGHLAEEKGPRAATYEWLKHHFVPPSTGEDTDDTQGSAGPGRPDRGG